MAKPYRKPKSPFWWIAPTIDGVQVHQSSGEREYDAADRKLKILEGKVAANAPITAHTDRGSFKELLELVRTSYKVNRRRNLYTVEKIIDVALKCLHHLPAAKAWLELDNYIVERREKGGVQDGTINNELRVVRFAYRLGARKGLVSFVPPIAMLPIADARDGYYAPKEFKYLLTFCSPLLASILTVAYITGWRLKSVLRLPWHQVDFEAGFLWQTEVKNAKATRWPIDVVLEQVGVSLRTVLTERRRVTDALKASKGRITPCVFHRDGKPVLSVRGAFEAALKNAGISERVFHDLRGTAIINLLEAGADVPSIMNMVGLKTEHMVIHYAKKRGMREDRLREVGRLLEMRLKDPKTGSSITPGVIL